jgi:hypothetical protein
MTINWRFTTEDARIKLKRLYPVIEQERNVSIEDARLLLSSPLTPVLTFQMKLVKILETCAQTRKRVQESSDSRRNRSLAGRESSPQSPSGGTAAVARAGEAARSAE